MSWKPKQVLVNFFDPLLPYEMENVTALSQYTEGRPEEKCLRCCRYSSIPWHVVRTKAALQNSGPRVDHQAAILGRPPNWPSNLPSFSHPTFVRSLQKLVWPQMIRCILRSKNRHMKSRMLYCGWNYRFWKSHFIGFSFKRIATVPLFATTTSLARARYTC